jgi:hypothetical protein
VYHATAAAHDDEGDHNDDCGQLRHAINNLLLDSLLVGKSQHLDFFYNIFQHF